VSGAVLLLAPRFGGEHAKGGELALELVRMGPEGQLRTPDSFFEDDRFKALLTCPPGRNGYVDVLVVQDGHASTPLDAQRIEQCGNRRTLSGAFRLTGTAPAQICVMFASTRIDRSQLTGNALPLGADSVCETVTPAGISAESSF
jgi:hypothetical protein